MRQLYRCFLLLTLVVFSVGTVFAQDVKIQAIHKVKRQETLFGIAKKYGVTIDELTAVNPQMRVPGFSLKKGEKLNIPFHVEKVEKTEKEMPVQEVKPAKSDVRSRDIVLGVMLPLHDKNSDGKDMVEYYRGILMACDSLKQEGISVKVHAWNLSEETDLNALLNEKAVSECDLIIGPYYSKHLETMAGVAADKDIRLLSPFIANLSGGSSCPNVFPVLQSDHCFNDVVMSCFLNQFSDYKTVFIDCNDPYSKKGNFTTGLRKKIEASGGSFSITNLNTDDAAFSKAFSRTQPNIVVLNSDRSPQLNVAFSKLNNITLSDETISVSMFGYPEWMNYRIYNLDNYYKFNTYIPATFYLNPLSARTARFEKKYRWNFHEDMKQVLPRFAILGFDHAYFYIKGMKMHGTGFDGSSSSVSYVPIQSPLNFKKTHTGGYQNVSVVFVHYTVDNKIKTIIF